MKRPVTRKQHDSVALDADESIRQRVARDAKFRRALLCEAIEHLVAGDMGTAKLLLRDYIAGSIGYETLSHHTHIPSKSLIRMFGPAGNPRADNLFAVVQHLQRAEGIRVRATIRKAS